MTSREKGKPLPKFGEWDVNDPASGDGFTVIFAKARDEKKAKTTTGSSAPSSMKEDVSPTRRPHGRTYDPSKKKWLCCF